MDDILFRHTAVATPNDKGSDFLQRQAESEKDNALVNEAKRFDSDLQSLLKVEIPENLAEKILFEQRFSADNKRRRNNPWYIAIAASIAFVLGISLPLLTSLNSSPLDIGTVAMAHVQEEYYFTAKIDEQASRAAVNAKLASYGGRVKGELGDVFFVNYCSFAGTSALHLIMQGEKGRVTVFVVPGDAELIATAAFNNQHLKGITEKMGKTHVVIVGEKDEPLEKTNVKLQKNIQWNI